MGNFAYETVNVEENYIFMYKYYLKILTYLFCCLKCKKVLDSKQQLMSADACYAVWTSISCDTALPEKKDYDSEVFHCFGIHHATFHKKRGLEQCP